MMNIIQKVLRKIKKLKKNQLLFKNLVLNLINHLKIIKITISNFFLKSIITPMKENKTYLN